MIVAKITVFDDETQKVYKEDTIIEPVSSSVDPETKEETYIFRFGIKIEGEE